MIKAKQKARCEATRKNISNFILTTNLLVTLLAGVKFELYFWSQIANLKLVIFSARINMF
jgi:hypothetical protein